MAVMGGLSKPLLALLVTLTLSGLGAGVWGFLTIPGLYDQIEELEIQVDRLTGQVDRLEVEVNELAEQVDRLEDLKEDLNATVQNLNVTVDKLQDNVDDIQLLNQELANETARLKESNLELEHLADTLNQTVSVAVKENDRLQQLNSNLEVIVFFLNETSLSIDETLNSVTEYLAEQIVANRHILLETLENTFTGQINNWDCALQDVFQFESYDAPIATSTNMVLKEVLDYVDGRVLQEFCANREDFEAYLDSTYGLESMSVDNLRQGVAVYTTAITNYFFPNPGQSGLTIQEWADADYNCFNVPKFSMSNR
jgi:outer membrane murein-binding lipoprotein Lpp